MKRCLDAYLNQELMDEKSEAVETHVNECESCWRELVELRDLSLDFDLDDPELQRMVMAEPSPLPQDFTQQVLQRIDAEKPTGLNVVWPWLKRGWTRRQITSVAYAMSATAVIVSAGQALYLWNATTDRASVLLAQGQAYWDALGAHFAGVGAYLVGLWQWLTTVL